jgi:hypothetical protein
MIYAALIRRLRSEATFEQFREAWLPDESFDVPVTVANALRVDDPRELLSLGRVISPAQTLQRPSSASPRAKRGGMTALQR